MNNYFGIHIGNTNVSLSHCKNGEHLEIVCNELGEKLTPAIVTVGLSEADITVGTGAKHTTISKGVTTVTSNKILMYKQPEDKEKTKYHEGTKTMMRNGEIHYCISTFDEKIHYVTPKQIMIYIFKMLYSIAQTVLNSNETGLCCVLLSPQNVLQEYCTEYRSAAEEAGWKVAQIIHETGAAVLAYSLLDVRESEEGVNVLVYRVGGSTCEVAVYQISDGMLSTLGVENSQDIGGNQFIHILTEYLANEFYRKYKLRVNENHRSMNKLKLAAENCIHTLSKMPSACCYVESLHEGVDFTLNVSRARFELLIQPVIASFIRPIQTLLANLQLEEPINKVLLCGGATNVPVLKSHVKNIFDSNVIVLSHLNPEEVLAMGAARQAFYLFDYGITTFLPIYENITTD